MSTRLIVLYLDGFDAELADRFIAEGRMPRLAQLLRESTRFRLDHGEDRYSGVAGRHFATGESSEESGFWSNIVFDTETYQLDQPHAPLVPFTEALGVRTVALDALHFALNDCRHTAGVVGWGAHDAGVDPQSNPAGLLDEIIARFGPYPAERYVYGHVWHNAALAADMAERVIHGVRLRGDIAAWLLEKRLPDWEVAIISVSEFHSAIESMWHGLDDAHPMHRLPSARHARKGLAGVYGEGDRLIGRLAEKFPDAAILGFSPHGMGRNMSDVPSFCLLPELLYRYFTGRTGFTSGSDWGVENGGGGDFARSEFWEPPFKERLNVTGPGVPTRPSALDWLPSIEYRPAWPEMKAFSVPAYHDGRVRVNLKGREARGIVDPRDYRAVLAEVQAVISACRDPRTGQPIEAVFNVRESDPLSRNATDSDMTIRFARDYYAFEHDGVGTIGPVPCRRTGGHTGGFGFGFYRDDSRKVRDAGCFRTVDIAATIKGLAGKDPDASPLAAKLLAERAAV